MRSVTVEQRRARLAWRHRLAPAARVDDDVAAITRDLVVLHATDPATMVLAAAVRMRQPAVAAVEAALYEDRTIVRMLGMRRTLFGVAAADLGTVQRSSSDEVAVVERRRFEKMLVDGGITRDPRRWLRGVERKTLAAVDELGEAAATDLTPRVAELARQIPVAQGKAYAGSVGVSSKVLFQLAVEGHLVRGRPKGGWTSGVHRWSRPETWLGEPIDRSLTAPEAKVQLAQRWLARFGPAPLGDLKWWTGWTLGATRAAAAELDIAEVELGGTTGLVLADDVDDVADPGPWVALLPGLDPTTMGWQQRAWYLGDHKPHVFDRNGNAGPTVWVDGRIVGGWAQRKDGEVVVRLLEDVGSERAAQVAAEAERLRQLVGDVRVTPRFPTPLDKELSA
jgi:hypothetical protein